MPGSSEVGAADIKLESFKCSINKITVSTDWKAPTSEVKETVTATVFDNKGDKEGRTIYLISSPEGKKLKVKVDREEGKCKRNAHKKYQVAWDDYKKEGEENVKDLKETPDGAKDRGDAATNSKATQSTLPIKPFDLKNTPQKKEYDLVSEDSFKIRCFEIGGALESIKYFLFPSVLDRINSTYFLYNSCKEGPVQFRVISYPDISFKVELTVGSKEAKKKGNGTSHLERQTSSIKYASERLGQLANDALDTNVKFCPPSLTISNTYNGEKDELELTFDFDSAADEYVHGRYKHDSREIELGTEFFQNVRGSIQKIIEIGKLIKDVCNLQFLKKLLDFDATSLSNNYKAYKFKLIPPSVSLVYEGRYHTSKDLLTIGKILDFSYACEPLVGVSLTVDLLFLLISAVSAGTGTGIYLMLKNLDDVVGKLLGDSYKKEYKDAKPFECDIYINLILTGQVNGGVHWLVDTTEKKNGNSSSGSVEGVIKVDLEAGAKCKLDVFIIAVEGEVSASGSSGIKLKVSLENHILQGEGLKALLEIIFLGLKIKYCVKGKAGLMKTVSYGGTLVDGENVILNKQTLLSTSKTFLVDKPNVSFAAGAGGAGGGGRSW